MAFARVKVQWEKIKAMEIATAGPPEGKDHRRPKKYFGECRGAAHPSTRFGPAFLSLRCFSPSSRFPQTPQGKRTQRLFLLPFLVRVADLAFICFFLPGSYSGKSTIALVSRWCGVFFPRIALQFWSRFGSDPVDRCCSTGKRWCGVLFHKQSNCITQQQINKITSNLGIIPQIWQIGADKMAKFDLNNMDFVALDDASTRKRKSAFRCF
ncbi:uncharacterized protein LOC119309351 [Triticum dicoccoides]|uniref:uncharacterized protein LOC119309351 n=1 Tax=Triticum dicoccoides TaxID=85692 RepID=UPI0018917054|nr:uncharacterized protein LOC119309351 [Triticum dicoccoides]